MDEELKTEDQEGMKSEDWKPGGNGVPSF